MNNETLKNKLREIRNNKYMHCNEGWINCPFENNIDEMWAEFPTEEKVREITQRHFDESAYRGIIDENMWHRSFQLNFLTEIMIWKKKWSGYEMGCNKN